MSLAASSASAHTIEDEFLSGGTVGEADAHPTDVEVSSTTRSACALVSEDEFLSGDTVGEADARPTVVEVPPRVNRAGAHTQDTQAEGRFCRPTFDTSSVNNIPGEWERALFNEFEPSRKRHRTAILASTAALAQRSGSVLPSLLPRGVSPREALALAQGMSPFDKALGLAFPQDTHRRVKFTNDNPKLAKCLRRRAILQLRTLSEKLAPARQGLAQKLSPNAPAHELNLPLITVLVRELNYPDKQLPHDLIQGMSIVGEMEPTNSLATRTISASTNLAQLKQNLSANNMVILDQLAQARNSILTEKCWELSLDEFRKGWLSEPVPVTAFDRSNTVLSPRFCIAEQHGNQEPKFRLIDDFSKSRVNDTVHSAETYCPEDLDSFVAIARLQHHHGARNLKAWSVDFSHAYKTIALHPDSTDAAFICFTNPNDNLPYKSRILVQPFGSRRAPANWGRVVTFIQFAALRLLNLVVGAFVDDVFCAEGAKIAKSGFWAFKQLCILLGFLTSNKKDQPPSTGITLLGADVTIFPTGIRAKASDQRVCRLQEHIAWVLRNGTLTPAAASKLRGKLGFFTSLLMGKLGRGMMGPLIAQQYNRHSSTVSTPLRRSLLWWYRAVALLTPRLTPFSLQPPFGAHSDAQGQGHVGCRVLLNEVSTTHTHLPEWFVQLALTAEGESAIYLFELCAAILTACAVIELSLESTRSCVLCIDNQAALAALIKGSASSELGTILVGVFWAVAARSPVQWWLEYVHTASNDADEPSRSCNAVAGHHCSREQGPIPKTFADCFQSWTALHSASTRI